ncbi:LAFE_0H16908g1_1 [Lachancea fermentati]|uniref:LAFE_0H16908g1_1 n=1 Tax=Lachancea fermentati TaxID=4955 RepID=A0A1G4ML20_LACFM|nr:LAFE_0H16908g1_1 [Lachancea fermentati]
MNDPSMLVSRVADLERQIAMYEKLFQTFSAKLDHHFKKYDLVINTQQQQIKALNDVIATLLNDQYRYSGILRDKLTDSLDGIAATSTSLHDSGADPKAHARGAHDKGFIAGQDGGLAEPSSTSSTNESLNYGSSVNALLGDIISPESLTTTPNQPGLPSLPVKRAFANPNMDYSPKRMSMVETPTDAKLPSEQEHHNMAYASFKSTGDFSSLDNDGGRDAACHAASVRVTEGSSSYAGDDMRLDADANCAPQLPQPGDRDEEDAAGAKPDGADPNVKEELYYTCRGQRKKRSVFVGEFRFLSSPQSVMEIWKEYTEGFAGQPSLKDMELTYHTSWRREPGVSKKFFRRKVLCRAIEKGLERGYQLQEIVDILEKCRLIDPEKGLKQPIGWLCRHSNVPDVFK